MAAIGLRLLLAGKGLVHLAAAGLQWLFENPLRLVVVLLAAWMVWLQALTIPHLEANRDKWHAVAGQWEDNAHAWQAAHARLLANVRAAQLAAAAADRANVARVKREYQAINERTTDAYEARLSDTRAALERVRQQYAAAAAGDPRDGGRADVSGALTARCQALGAADCDALLAALPDRLAAAEDNTGKLIALQDWVRSTLLIDFSGNGAAASSSDTVGRPR
jgi:hypothetical protein